MKRSLSVFAFLGLAFSCSGKLLTPSKDKTNPAPAPSGLPFFQAIDIGIFFAPAKNGLALGPTIDAPCDGGYEQWRNGFFQRAFGNVCHSTGFSTEALFGREINDTQGFGVVACNYMYTGRASDLVLALCDKQVDGGQNVTDASIGKSDGTELKVSFAKVEPFNVTGSWRNSDGNDIPALIRLWRSSASSQDPDFAVHVVNNSQLEFWTKADMKLIRRAIELQVKKDVAVRSSYKGSKDTSKCSAEPSDSNCLLQDVALWYGPPSSGSYENTPDGLRVKVLAERAASANFMALEGMLVISDSNARWASINPSTNNGTGQTFFENGRSFYFQAIRDQGEVWARMVIRDGNGAIAQGYDVFQGSGPILAAEEGHCIALVDSDPLSTVPLEAKLGLKSSCAKIDASLAKYKSIWQGEDKFTKPSADWVSMPSEFNR
jgi:hypothetical protein